jgi:hypothetical protein
MPNTDGSKAQGQAKHSLAQHCSPSGKHLTLDAAQKLAEGNMMPTQLLDFLAKMDRWAIAYSCIARDCKALMSFASLHAQQLLKQHDASLVSGTLLQAPAYVQRHHL